MPLAIIKCMLILTNHMLLYFPHSSKPLFFLIHKLLQYVLFCSIKTSSIPFFVFTFKAHYCIQTKPSSLVRSVFLGTVFTNLPRDKGFRLFIILFPKPPLRTGFSISIKKLRLRYNIKDSDICSLILSYPDIFSFAVFFSFYYTSFTVLPAFCLNEGKK